MSTDWLGANADHSLVFVLGLIVASAALIAYRAYDKFSRQPFFFKQVDHFPGLTPAPAGFDWASEPSRAYRPFRKGPYNLTMGLRNLTQEDWLLVENTYLDYTNERARIVADPVKEDHTVVVSEEARESLEEFYDLSLEYMCKKYPMCFMARKEKSVNGDGTLKDMLYNNIRKESVYRYARDYEGDTRLLVHTLSRTIEEDFLIMMPDKQTNEYFLRGGAFVFPSGLDPKAKAHLSLTDIHGPVPSYVPKLQKSMDKFFIKLQTGKFAMRVNWTCQAHTNLYAVGLNHITDEETEFAPLEAKALDFEKVFLRNERQCLIRLPRTKSIVFTIKTYLTPMTKLRQEEAKDDLVAAIEALPEATRRYKHAVSWGGAICEYLRGECDGIGEGAKVPISAELKPRAVERN